MRAEALEHGRRVGRLVQQRPRVRAHEAVLRARRADVRAPVDGPDDAHAQAPDDAVERRRLRRPAERALGVLGAVARDVDVRLVEARRRPRLEPVDHVARADHQDDDVDPAEVRQDTLQQRIDRAAGDERARDVADVGGPRDVLARGELALDEHRPAVVLVEEEALGGAPARDQHAQGRRRVRRHRVAALAVPVRLEAHALGERRDRVAVEAELGPRVRLVHVPRIASPQARAGGELGANAERGEAEEGGDRLGDHRASAESPGMRERTGFTSMYRSPRKANTSASSPKSPV